MDILSSISTSLEITKKLRDLSKAVSEADFKMLLAELTGELADAKLAAANLKSDLADARDEIASLKARLETKELEKPRLVGDTYIFSDEPQRRYCTGCFDSSGRRITLSRQTGHWVHFGEWKCPVCDKTYGQSAM